MKVSIFGAGYVGVVSAACLANDGHDVIAVDPNEEKVNQINQARSPIIEQDLPELIEKAVNDGKLAATTDYREGLAKSSLSYICVGTPSHPNGELNLDYIELTCEQIGGVLAEKNDFHSVVVRSTMLPGTINDKVVPILEGSSGKQAGRDFGVAVYPEFLREGNAIHDYYNSAVKVFGTNDNRVLENLRELNEAVPSREIHCSPGTAEAVKYANNAWHATKISFANEIGAICKSKGIDSHEVMQVVCADDRLNISSTYMRPGFAYGGSCLPKDLRAICDRAKKTDVDIPMLNGVLSTNNVQIERVVEKVRQLCGENRKIGLFGLAFKFGTDDLRESPTVALAERLIGKGYEVRFYDRNIVIDQLTGTNFQFITNRLNHFPELAMESKEELLEHCDVVVVANNDPDFKQMVKKAVEEMKKPVVDLVRVDAELTTDGTYHGLYW